MKPTLCSRCKKNLAVIFITKIDGGKPVNEYYKRKSPTEGGGNEEPPSLEIKGNDSGARPQQEIIDDDIDNDEHVDIDHRFHLHRLPAPKLYPERRR